MRQSDRHFDSQRRDASVGEVVVTLRGTANRTSRVRAELRIERVRAPEHGRRDPRRRDRIFESVGHVALSSGATIWHFPPPGVLALLERHDSIPEGGQTVRAPDECDRGDHDRDDDSDRETAAPHGERTPSSDRLES